MLVVMWNCSSGNMMNMNLFINALFLAIAIIFSAIPQCSSVLSDKRLCYDPNCSEPVSLARTAIKYNPNEPGLLSFDVNVQAKVYSKEAGKRNDLWGVEINGKRGYVSKHFLREYKVLQKNLSYVVSTDPSSNNVLLNEKPKPKKDNDKSILDTKDTKASAEQINNLNLKSTEELPHNVTSVIPPYEVIDGTTVHLDQKEVTIEPAFVKESIQTTVVPNTLQDAVDDSGPSLPNGKTESDVFTETDKVSQKVLNDKLKTKELTGSVKVDIKDFVTSSEEILSSSEISSEQVSPLNISTDEAESTIKNVENKLFTDVQDKKSVKEVIDTSASQTPISDDAKETLNMKTKVVVELDKKENIIFNGTVANNDTKPDIEKTGTNGQIQTQDSVQLLKNVTVVANNNTKSEVQTAEIIDTIKTQDTQPLEVVDTIKTQDTQPLEVVNTIKTQDTQPLAVVDTIKTQDTQPLAVVDAIKTQDTQPLGVVDAIKTQDTQPLAVVDTIKTQDTQPLVVVDTIKTQDTQPLVVVDTIKTQDTQPLEVVDTIKTQDTQPLVGVDTIKTQDTQPLEVVDTIKTQDTQPLEVIDTIKTQDTQPLENVTTVATGDMKLDDEQKLEISDNIETKDSESLENVTVVVSNNTESEIQHAGSSDKVEIADTQSLESVTIVPTNDTGPDIQNVESTEKLETRDIPFLDSVTTNAKDTPQFESITEGTQQNELKKEGEEIKSTEDLSKHGNNEYMSPLFLQLSMKNEIPITLPSNNIEAPPQMIENTNEFDTQNVPSNSNIMDTFIKEGTPDADDTILAEEATSDVQYDSNIKSTFSVKEAVSENNFYDTSDLIPQESPPVCMADNVECFPEDSTQNDFPHHEQFSQDNENAIISGIQMDSNYWLTLMYLSVTATAMLIFSLGFYCIENMRRDRQLIARINKLEKDLLISEAECAMVNDNLKSTKEKLSRMEDESFGSDEMVLSLRADLEASQSAKTELEDQVAMLEKDLESATEAGLELEKMLREFLSTNNEVNPLAQSVEDLQTRLNAQQTANESLTNALNLKTQENEALSAELISVKKKYEELDMEFTRVTENLKLAVSSKNSLEQMLTDKVQQLEMQIIEISTEKTTLQKELKGKEAEAKDLVDVISRLNSNNLDLDKLYDVSRIKSEAAELLEERNELKVRLAEVEGAHNLLEEHVKVVKEEMLTLSEQCKAAEKEKKDAETRLEVLTNFFEEKEAQRQKEEAIWLQQQGEVVSTVERIQTMQSEIQNYKQQIEMLKREILDQEREYKNQISVLQTKAHEQWVIARQVERRLEESKVEAGQLRNRLTLIEKNINEVDSEAKLHRLEANGETTTSPPLFLGAESSSSPIMFSGSSSVPPPPPPSYLHSLFPPYLPPPLPNSSGVPPYEVSQRPPPLGGRLSSPPPMPLHPAASSRYDNASSPPPMSPHLLPPFNHRSPPPPFVSDMHPPPPPPPGSILPPPLGTPHSWGEESLPHPRNCGFHPTQRERVRNHKGSLHSSGDSLDKLHHNSKV